MDKFLGEPGIADWLQHTNHITRLFLSAGNIPDLINLAGGLPAPQLFPVEQLAEFAKAAILEDPAQTLGYSPVEGFAALRDHLAERLSSDALKLTRQHVLVTTSGMQALDLVGKVLLHRHAVIATQAPTYLGALDAWRPYVPVYRCFGASASRDQLRGAFDGCRFAYAVPNFSNPTGKLVDAGTRQALVDTAEDTGSWLVEDDPYGKLYYDARPLPRLIDLAAAKHSGEAYAGRVIYLGTLSKEMVPGLRIGWIAARPAMIEALTMAKQGSDMCTSGLSQQIALRALSEGLIERRHADMIALYQQRRDALCAAMTRHLSRWFDWDMPHGGMFVWAVARDPNADTDQLLQPALAQRVCFSPGSVFSPDGTDRRAIRLNFTLNAPDRLELGVQRLAAAAATLWGHR